MTATQSSGVALRVAVIGSRQYPKLSAVRHRVRALIAKHGLVVLVSGGARGVDAEAERTAAMMGAWVVSYRPIALGDIYGVLRIEMRNGHVLSCTVEEKVFPTYGKAAYWRNERIVADGSHVMAFWDKESDGTAQGISLATGAKPLYVYGPDGELDDQYTVALGVGSS